MFGPLNGVRVVLVFGAGLAALVAFFLGEIWVGMLLVAGIIVHGLGWLYLYRQRGGADSSPHQVDEGAGHRPGSLP